MVLEGDVVEGERGSGAVSQRVNEMEEGNFLVGPLRGLQGRVVQDCAVASATCKTLLSSVLLGDGRSTRAPQNPPLGAPEQLN